MTKFFLPYSKDAAAEGLLMQGGKAWRFPSRKAALAFAMHYCRDDHPDNSEQAFISIEGQDGRWRSFDAHLQPLPSG